MKAEMGYFIITIFLLSAGMVFPCNAEAGPRGGRAVEGPRGGRAVEGPRGNVAVQGPRGNIAIGTKYPVLPDGVKRLMVGSLIYYVDDSGVYYMPCEDDKTVYCVVPAPE